MPGLVNEQVLYIPRLRSSGTWSPRVSDVGYVTEHHEIRAKLGRNHSSHSYLRLCNVIGYFSIQPYRWLEKPLWDNLALSSNVDPYTQYMAWNQ